MIDPAHAANYDVDSLKLEIAEREKTVESRRWAIDENNREIDNLTEQREQFDAAAIDKNIERLRKLNGDFAWDIVQAEKALIQFTAIVSAKTA